MKQANENQVKPTGKKIGHYANQHFILVKRVRERERRAGFSHLQEDYVIPKIANYCMYYVRVGMSVCVCVCVTVRMRNVRKRKR